MTEPTTSTDLLAASGTASGEDAAARAAADAVAGVGGKAALLIAFPSGLDPDRAAAGLAAAAPGAAVAGMTGSGALSTEGAVDHGCAALAFAAGTPVGVGTSERAGRGLTEAARAATVEALTAIGDADCGTVALFVDTRSGDQAEAVSGAYAAAGAKVPLVGGGAGGDNPAQISGGRAHEDAVVAVAIGGATPAGVGLAHGCRTVGVPAIATRSEGRFLFELDGRPATDVYLERLRYPGAEFGSEEFRALAVTHPLAQPEPSGESRLRHVLGRGPQGGLECATHIPADAAIEFTHQTPVDIVAASGRSVRTALSRLEAPPRAALIFDCAGRKQAVASSLEHQVNGLLEGFGPQPPPLAGMFSHGEIYRHRGAKGDRNHAVVVAAFA